MQVVQHQHQRPPGRRALQEGGHGIEESETRSLGLELGRGRQIGEEIAELREEPGEVGGSLAKLGSETVRVGIAKIRPQRLHPGPVGGGAARLPAAADQDPRAARSRLCDQLLGQAALADPGLADKQEQPAAACEGVIETADELSQLAVATHKGAPCGLHCRLVRRRLLRRQVEFGILGEYRPLELAEPLTRLDAQLPDQCPAGVLVGLQRVRLAVRAVQRQHQLRPQALPVGVLADQRLELPHHLGMTT